MLLARSAALHALDVPGGNAVHVSSTTQAWYYKDLKIESTVLDICYLKIDFSSLATKPNHEKPTSWSFRSLK